MTTESEVARLREEAAVLSEASAKERRAALAIKAIGRTEGLDTCALSEVSLVARLRDVLGLDVSSAQARDLLQVCGAQTSPLSFVDLAGEAFEVALAELVDAARSKQRDQRIEAFKRASQAADTERKRAAKAAAIREDRSAATSIVAALAYLLPLLDGLMTGFAYVPELPGLENVLDVLTIPSGFLRSLPLGPVFLFVALVFFALNQDLPRMLRFSCRQAVYLDIVSLSLALIAFVTSVDGSIFGSPRDLAPTTVASELTQLSLVLVLIVALNCLISTALGRDADDIPFLSAAAHRDTGYDGT